MGKSKKKSKSRPEQAKSPTEGAVRKVETWDEEVRREEDEAAAVVKQNETQEENWDEDLKQNTSQEEAAAESGPKQPQEENWDEELREEEVVQNTTGRRRKTERDWNNKSTSQGKDDSKVYEGHHKNNSWRNSNNSSGSSYKNNGGSDYTKNRTAGSYNTRRSEVSVKHDRGEERGDKKRHTWNDNTNRRWRDDSDHRKNRYPRSNQDSEYDSYWDEFRSHRGDIKYAKVEEITKNLFDMPENYSLAHCVAEDFNMGSGIAVQFRRDFRRVDELLNQRQRKGGLAILKDKERYIYYLVTKQFSSGKPTYETLFSSLKMLREHIIEHRVKNVAMPRIGCGLDRLDWDNVKFMVEFLFKDVDVEIVVCNLESTEESPQQNRHRNCRVTHTKSLLHNIETGTGVIYFSSEDGAISEEMIKMDEKVPFLREFRTARKTLGNVILYTKQSQDYLVCTCIVKKTKTDPFDFTALQKCVATLQRENKKLLFYYFAFQAFRDNDDASINYKIINILRNGFRDVEVYVCWPEELESEMMPKDRFSSDISSNDSKEQETKYFDKNYWRSSNSQKWGESGSGKKSRWDESSPAGKDEGQKDDSFRSDTSYQEFNVQANSDYWDTDEKQQSSSIPSRADSQLNPETPSFKPRNEPQNPTPTQADPNAGKPNTSDDNYKLFEKELELGSIVNTLLKEEKSAPALPKNYSRVCFAREDLIIESGIPTGPDISQKIGKLLNFNQKEGGLAVLKEENGYFYCLIISKSNAPSSPVAVFSAIEKLYDHAKKNQVRKLVIPVMDLENLQSMFKFVFKKSNIELIFAPYESSYSESHLKQKTGNKLIHGRNAIHQMKKKSIVLYLASADGHFTPEMNSLVKKFEDFANDFRKKKKALGDVIRYKQNEDHVVYGCIVKKDQSDDINFEYLQKCISEVQEENSKKEKLEIVGIPAVNSEDESINFKIVTILLNTLQSVTIQMCWPGDLRDRMPTTRK